METNWMSYCFIDYPNFLIANSPYLSPWENPSCFSNSTSKQAKLPDFRTPSYFQLSCVMLTAWGCVVDVVLSQIKDRWQKFQSVLTYEKIIEKFFLSCFLLLVCLGLHSSHPPPTTKQPRVKPLDPKEIVG